MKLKLPSVTLLIVDCVDFSRAKLVYEHCCSQVEFGNAKILTSLAEADSVIKIDEIKSIESYNNFMIKKLTDYFNTEHVLIAQWDGFVVDVNMWTDDFLKFDYCGAPWSDETITPGVDKKYNVGNGGFSLRSKRLQDFLKNDSRVVTSRPGKYFPRDYVYAEDVAICQINRPLLEENGFRFANYEIASIFSWENGIQRKTFGQHGRLSLPINVEN